MTALKTRLRQLAARALYDERALPLSRRLASLARRLDSLLLNQDNDPGENGEYSLLTAFGEAQVLIDVGFNIGDWSREALRVIPNAHVHAFDPDRTVAERAAGLQNPRFSFQQLALADHDGVAQFQSSEGAAPTNSLERSRLEMRDGDSLETYEVPVRRLDSWCTDNDVSHVDLLKIDAEGYDFDVIRGAAGLIEQGAIDAVVFEYGYAWLEVGHLLVQAMRWFEERGYHMYRLYPGFLARYQWHFTHENRVGGQFVAVREGACTQISRRAGPW